MFIFIIVIKASVLIEIELFNEVYQNSVDYVPTYTHIIFYFF